MQREGNVLLFIRTTKQQKGIIGTHPSRLIQTALKQCSHTKILSKDPLEGERCWSPRRGARPRAQHCPSTTGTGTG